VPRRKREGRASRPISNDEAGRVVTPEGRIASHRMTAEERADLDSRLAAIALEPEDYISPGYRGISELYEDEPNLTGAALVAWYRAEFGEKAILSEHAARLAVKNGSAYHRSGPTRPTIH
jgi:hypothetical protein